MSNQDDNIQNRKLKEFLDKKNSEHSDMDDFEKDALEGFSMLKSEEEAFDMKSELDKRVYAELFIEEKKSRNGYWFAAAGLFLVIGFTVYFIQTSQNSLHENLAISEEKIQTGDEIQKNIEQGAKKNESFEFKEPEGSNGPAGKIENQAITAKQSDGLMTAKDGELKNPQKQNVDDLGKSSEPDQGTKGLGASETADKQMEEKAPLANTVKFTPPVEKNDIKVANEDLTINTTPEMDRQEVLSEVAVIESSKQQEKKKSISRRPEKESVNSAEKASAGAAQPALPLCYYEGGEEKLNKDLKVYLSSRNLVQKFDATLFVNKKGKVEKVILTSAYGLGKDEQQEVITILKKLEKFNFTGAASAVFPLEYKLVFRP